MIALLKKPLIFLWRDFIEETSYKLSFAMSIFGILSSTLVYFFLSKLLGDAGLKFLQPYGGNYFSFVLIGVAFFSYLGVSVKGISNSIREGQKLGTLEALLVTQTEIPTIIVSSSLYSFLWASFKVAVYLFLGIVLFGIDIGHANLAGAFLILILTITSFISFGIISASFVMVLKKGDPVGWLFTSLSALLGGLYYPVSVLPDWLQHLSYVLPVTYALEGMRLALLKGYSFHELFPNIIALVLFSCIMIPLSIVIFGYAVKRAKEEGSLTHY
ncbi:MAG: ABC transporter permease [Thermodesulfovibrionales bacterium]